MVKWSGNIKVNGKKFSWERSASNGSLEIFDAEFNKIGYAKTIAMARKIAASYQG